jgi:diacylglycerol kinase family enzyme
MPDGQQRTRRCALIYNPVKADPARLRSHVAKAARAAGWQAPLYYETTPEDLGQDVTARALHEGVDAVLVAGGDGTVRAVSEALIGSRTPLTIVPSGTGNLLARNLALPLTDPDAAIAAAFTGERCAIDIGMMQLTREDGTTDEHAFVVLGGVGLDAAMIANTRTNLKKTMGWVAYIDGAARSLPKARSFRVVYQLIERRLHTTKIHSMMFANCGDLPAGIALVPGASVVDGMLDVAIIQPTGWFGWLGVWRKVWWDNSVMRRARTDRHAVERRHDSSVHYLRGTSIDAAVDIPQPVQIDGDEFGRAVRITARVLPGQLLLSVPVTH